jgi:hypothetical protein
VQLAQQRHTVAISGYSDNDEVVVNSDNGERDSHVTTQNILRSKDGASVPLSGVFVLEDSEVRPLLFFPKKAVCLPLLYDS